MKHPLQNPGLDMRRHPTNNPLNQPPRSEHLGVSSTIVITFPCLVAMTLQPMHPATRLLDSTSKVKPT